MENHNPSSIPYTLRKFLVREQKQAEMIAAINKLENQKLSQGEILEENQSTSEEEPLNPKIQLRDVEQTIEIDVQGI